MTSKLFIIPSTIQPREGRFTYSNTRSVFTAEERLRQTIFTINSIQNAYPEGKVVLLDSSDNPDKIIKSLKYIPNLQTLFIKDIDPETSEIINTHSNKSLCECLIMNTFYKHFRKEIKQYDYVIKTCGRYFYMNFKDYFTEENKNKIFFKKPLSFNWNDAWKYHFVDLRDHQKNDKLQQYCTVLFAFGSAHLEKFIDINDAAIHFIKQPKMHHYDIETLSYYLTRPYEKDIIEVDWIVSGWDGTSGRFMCY
jgi:hypothetical protein